MTVLYDQFSQLNEDFSSCIGDLGEFSGNIEHFRRRHQAICRSVQEADRFLKISNGAGLPGPVATIILTLYSVIFYRDDTILHDPETAVLYVAWFGTGAFQLALVTGQAMILNHKASCSSLLIAFLDLM